MDLKRKKNVKELVEFADQMSTNYSRSTFQRLLNQSDVHLARVDKPLLVFKAFYFFLYSSLATTFPFLSSFPTSSFASQLLFQFPRFLFHTTSCFLTDFLIFSSPISLSLRISSYRLRRSITSLCFSPFLILIPQLIDCLIE